MNDSAAGSKHWRRTVDEDAVCWLTLDRADAAVNTLSSDVLAELERELDVLRTLPLRGVVFDSGKRRGFILGADVKEFGDLRDAARAAAMAARGQALLGRIAALEVPTVAAIDGFALGGGMELALACDYRIVVESYERTLGLPEVQLGIHPGFGGSVRTVEILGPAARARSHVDGPVALPTRGLQVRARRSSSRARSAAERREEPHRSSPPLRRAPWYLGLLSLPPLRGLLAARVRARRSQAREA